MSLIVLTLLAEPSLSLSGQPRYTVQLTLPPIALDDVDLPVGLDSDPRVMRYLTGRPSTREEAEAAVRDNMGCRWIATDRHSGAFVGWFSLIPEDDDSYFVGYRLVREWWGRGLALRERRR